MSDFGGIILRAIVGIANGIIGFVQILHWSDRRISGGSVVGESRIDKEARDWRGRLFLHWQWAAAALLVLAAMAGGGYWLLSL